MANAATTYSLAVYPGKSVTSSSTAKARYVPHRAPGARPRQLSAVNAHVRFDEYSARAGNAELAITGPATLACRLCTKCSSRSIHLLHHRRVWFWYSTYVDGSAVHFKSPRKFGLVLAAKKWPGEPGHRSKYRRIFTGHQLRRTVR